MAQLSLYFLLGYLCCVAVVHSAELQARPYAGPVTRTSTAPTTTSLSPTTPALPDFDTSFLDVNLLTYALNVLVPVRDLFIVGFARFSPEQLRAAGLSDQDTQTLQQYNNKVSDIIEQIRTSENAINAFTSAEVCERFRDFELTTVSAFLTLLRSLATVVISAHTDAVNNFANTDNKNLLSSILPVEITQLVALNSIQGGTSSNAVVVPLGRKTVVSVISNYYDTQRCFIAGNRFPTRLPLLAVTPSAPRMLPAGTILTLDYLNIGTSDQCVFLMSFNTVSGSFGFRKQLVPIINKTCTVPSDATGYVSIVIAQGITNGNDQTDANSIAAGPVLESIIVP